MTNTLLIRLQAPMQAWGVQSLFDCRDSCREPTKSGVIGLLCCALGRRRDENLDDLTSLRMGIRVDQEGILMKDFQTARNIINASGSLGNNIISDRFYLSDAVFLVGLAGEDEEQLHNLLHALQHPRWLLFLGRRAFPPSKPVWLPDGLRLNCDLESSLKSYPFLGEEKTFQQVEKLRLLIEDSAGSITQWDYPLSFASRTFQPRARTISFVEKPDAMLKEVADVS